MRIKICQKIIITLFLVLFYSSSFMLGQLKNFGAKAKIKPEPNYSFSFYGYVDIARESGLGFQWQLFSKYNIDVAAYLINPNTYFKDKLRQWDYWDLKGFGFNIKPKYQFDLLGKWYISPNIAFEWLKHEKTWVEHMVYYHEIVNFLEETHGKAYTIGFNFGRKIMMNRIVFEPFIGLGITTFKGEKTTYEIDNPRLFSTQTYPIKESYEQTYFQFNVGLKFGLSFKKNKKHIAIDQKFDEVYIPRAKQLMDYFKTMDKKTIEASKNLRMAYSRTKKLNRSILLRFKNNYSDSSAFYRKVDTLFQKIDFLLIKDNQ
jgi:hypothetical protein